MEHRSGKPRIRLTFQRSSTLMKAALIAAVVLSMAALLTLTLARNRAQDQTDTLRDQASALEEANSQLERNIDELGTIQSVERIAQEELGLADPDTIMFKP